MRWTRHCSWAQYVHLEKYFHLNIFTSLPYLKLLKIEGGLHLLVLPLKASILAMDFSLFSWALNPALIFITSFSVAIKKILNLNAPLVNSSTSEPVWKVLVYDKYGQDVISPVLAVKELRDLGVTLHMWVPAQCYATLIWYDWSSNGVCYFFLSSQLLVSTTFHNLVCLHNLRWSGCILLSGVKV